MYFKSKHTLFQISLYLFQYRFIWSWKVAFHISHFSLIISFSMFTLLHKMIQYTYQCWGAGAIKPIKREPVPIKPLNMAPRSLFRGILSWSRRRKFIYISPKNYRSTWIWEYGILALFFPEHSFIKYYFKGALFLKKTFALILKHLTEIISCYEYILTFKLQWGSMYVILTLSIYTI